MKIREILSEGGTGSLTTGVAKALPATLVVPELQNQDGYRQYRTVLAMAAIKAGKEKEFQQQSEFGENMTVIGYTDDDIKLVKKALKMMGASKGAKLLGSKTSDEAEDANKMSPVAKPKKNKYGV